jgi:MarR family transcriptional regulator, organic hydroperoxide resistance regulator
MSTYRFDRIRYIRVVRLQIIVIVRPQMNPADPTDPTNPKLADFLCFAIYSANLAYGRAYKPILEELGLTYTQYIAIVALWEEDNQTVGGLGEKLFLESNTLTPILKKLEGMGYLRRQRDPADERQVLVSLTDAGRRLREKGLGMNLVEASGLTADEFPRMQKAVVTLRNNLIKAAKGKG